MLLSVEALIVNALGISYEAFNYFVLPLLIFLARVSDVTLSTMRVMFIMNGTRRWAALLGFFESLIWLLAIGQIIQNIDNIYSYFAYASGFATGTWVGMFVESKIALGRVVVRVITKTDTDYFRGWLKGEAYRFASVSAYDHEGNANLIFTVVRRNRLSEFIQTMQRFHPEAYYTIEGVKSVGEKAIALETPSERRRFSTLVRR